MTSIATENRDNSNICNFYVTLSNTISSPDREILEILSTYLEPGNLIPNSWYKKIIDKNNSPDFTAISLLSEIIAQYRFSSATISNTLKPDFDLSESSFVYGKSLITSYSFFVSKFCITKEKIRRGLIRLEELKILKREAINVQLSNGNRTNKLSITIDLNFLKSCFRNPELDIRESSSNSFSANKRPYEISYHHISNKNNDLKNRSMESNFYQNSFEEKEKKEESNIETKKDKKYFNKPTEEKKTIGSILKSYFAKSQKLEEFYPLTKEDGDQLRSTSGREFSLNAMNEILLSLTKKLPNHAFPNKSAFINYMSKVFTYEMRDAIKTSNETFRIIANHNIKADDEDIVSQEKYLSQIENSLEVGPEWHLRKKIASVFERKKAYEILTSLKWMRRVEVEKDQGIDLGKELEIEEGTVGRRKRNAEQEDTLILVLNKEIELSLMDKEILLSQVKATHDGVGDSERRIGRIELQLPKKEISKKQAQNEFISETEQQGIWYQIRKEIKKYIGEDGEAIDKSWFSKLKVEEDTQTKSLMLQAPSEFVKDWVQQNYNWLIEKSCTQFNYKHNFA